MFIMQACVISKRGMPVSGSSTFKARIALSASLGIIALAVSGCSLTSKKPEVATITDQGPRPVSAAEAMQRAQFAKQSAQAKKATPGFVDPLVSARPGQSGSGQNATGQNVSDFRASGRSAMNAMRSNGTAPQTASATNAAAIPEMSESAMAGIVTQPTGIQAGRNSIFSASAAPAADITASGDSAPAPHVTSASGSLSTDAVAYAPVRRISGTMGGLFAGGPQVASNTDTGNAPAAASHAPPGIATRPTVSAAAEPVAQGLW